MKSSELCLSIVIPIHDEGLLLRDAVDSALGQRTDVFPLPRYELILVADRADELTLSVARDLISDNPDTIRSVENHGTAGPGASRNVGIMASKGEWVAFLDGDDCWTPSSLAFRWKALAEHPGIEWMGAEYAAWNGEVEETRDLLAARNGWLRSNEETRQLLADAFAREAAIVLKRPASEFISQVLCCTDTVIARRDLLLRVGLFDESLRRAEDVHLWYRLAAASDYLFVPEISALYRQRSSTCTRRGLTPMAHHNLALEKLLVDPTFAHVRDDLRKKLAFTLNTETFYLRESGQFLHAAALSLRSARQRLFQRTAYRNLLAALLMRR